MHIRRTAWLGGGLLAVAAWAMVSPLPADEPPADTPAPSPTQTSLAAAWELVRTANWEGATEAFEKLAPSSDTETAAEAKYALGYIWQYRANDADVEKAQQYYTEVAKAYPNSRVAAWAMLSLARIEAVPPHKPDPGALANLRRKARTAYGEIIARYPNHMAAVEATLWLGMSYLRPDASAGVQEQGQAILGKYLARHPENYLASSMHLIMADYFYRQAMYKQCIEHLAASAKAGLPSSSDNAQCYFRIARIAELQLKDYALAATWYKKLVDEVHRDSRWYPAKMGYERCLKLQKAKGGGRG